MIRSLAAHIPCSKSVLVALMFSVAGGAYAQESPLTEQDKALIEQGKQIAQKAQKMEMPSLLQNQHMDEAQAEAKAFFKQLQTTNPTLKEMHRKQAEKGIYSDHRILVFASLSLGEQGLDDVLTAVSGQPDSVIVFRGIPEGMNLGQGVKAIQALAAKKDPVPNIIINPTLFKTYNITAVPTIVMLEDEPLPGEQPNVVAQVSGLSDPVWLAREVDTGSGKTSGITEIAGRLNWPVQQITAHGRMELTDLIGHHALVAEKPGQPPVMKFMYGPLAVAMREGHLLLINEVDLADPAELAGLNDVLEGRPLVIAQNGGEIIKPHPMFRVVVTGNSTGSGDASGLYQGVMMQNLAAMDRYRFTKVGYADEEAELSILGRATPKLPENVRKGMVRIANQVRKLFLGENGEDGQISVTMSTRTLVRWAKLSLAFRGAPNALEYALDQALLIRAAKEEREAILRVAKDVFGDQWR
ncbi:AAA domain-containing protein [Escherichia coli]|nr:AAA domain-containing protein [Escherichia coli]